MLQKKYLLLPGLLFVFISFFLSNFSAFIGPIIWLTTPLVFGESIIWIVLAALPVWILNKQNNITKYLENFKNNWIILPFFIFSGISIFWSVYWQISLYRWVILFCTIITGGYIGLRYDLKYFIKLLSFFGIFILLLCSIYVFLIPHIGVMNYYNIQGAWIGIYWHKNHMGLIATFINILFLINIIDSVKSKRKQVLFWGLLYIYSLLFVYQSDSVSAFFTTILLHGVILFALLWIKFRNKIRRSHYFIFIAVLIFGSLILWINADKLLGIFNRNTTLTGRIPMWTYLFDTYISKRPFLGYGFNAFWYLNFHRVAVQLAAGYPDPIVISDNGFIDILVNTGYGGLILFSIFYFGLWWRSVKYAIKASNIIGIFPIILMSFTLLANVSWSLIFENESFFMLIMISVLFCVSIRTQGTSQNQDEVLTSLAR
jgi:exopolysaccharide production protein ExoQ